MELPEEVELRWLALLPWTDLVRTGLVCTRWHRLGTFSPSFRTTE